MDDINEKMSGGSFGILGKVETTLDEQPIGFYRSTAVGVALTKALNSMIVNKEITFDEAIKVLEEFDKSVQSTIRENLPLEKGLENINIEGTLHNYNNSHGMWKIDATDVSLTINSKKRKYSFARLLFQK